MLRTLFEAAESAGGERLAAVAEVVYALGAALILWRALAPLLSGAFEGAAAGAGLHRGFTVTCNVCQARTRLGARCEKCNTALGLPAHVRLWAALNAPAKLRRSAVSFGLGVFASALFVIATAVVAASSGALSPRGVLEELFAGIAAIAWAGAAFLLTRTLSLTRLGPLTRIRELVFAGAALSVAVSALAVAQLARPVELRAVATLRAEGAAVFVNGQRLAIENGEVGLQYQIIESPALGTTLTAPLAFIGAAGASIKLRHDAVEDWLLDALWQRTQALSGRGFSVKRRAETFQVTAGETYELKMSEREPVLTKL
jgi:hypothetical protein